MSQGLNPCDIISILIVLKRRDKAMSMVKLKAGTGISLEANASNKEITINSTITEEQLGKLSGSGEDELITRKMMELYVNQIDTEENGFGGLWFHSGKFKVIESGEYQIDLVGGGGGGALGLLGAPTNEQVAVKEGERGGNTYISFTGDIVEVRGGRGGIPHADWDTITSQEIKLTDTLTNGCVFPHSYFRHPDGMYIWPGIYQTNGSHYTTTGGAASPFPFRSTLNFTKLGIGFNNSNFGVATGGYGYGAGGGGNNVGLNPTITTAHIPTGGFSGYYKRIRRYFTANEIIDISIGAGGLGGRAISTRDKDPITNEFIVYSGGDGAPGAVMFKRLG